MEFFVDSLNEFFKQVETFKPNQNDLNQFTRMMNEIIDDINIVEVDYHKKKFRKEYGEDESVIESMAQLAKIDFQKLPTRMQYWAKRGGWGDAIHNPKDHLLAVRRIESWPNPILSNNKAAQAAAFFKSPPTKPESGNDSDGKEFPPISGKF